MSLHSLPCLERGGRPPGVKSPDRPPAARSFPVVEQSLHAAERSLLDAIAAGDLDDHLDALAAAIGARRELLHTVRSATRLMSLCEGDVVRISASARAISPG